MLSGKLPLQNILLRKTFKVSLLTDEQSQKMNLNKIALTSGGFFGSNYENFFCKSVRDQLSTSGIESLLDRPNLFDSIITEKLNSLGSINTLAYLCEAYVACQTEQQKQMNKAPHNSQFLKTSVEMILNYAVLFMQTPELFQNHVPDISNFSSQAQAIAAAIDNLFNVSGFKLSFVNNLNAKLFEQNSELFRQVYRCLLLSLTLRIKNSNFHQIDTHDEFLILCNIMQNQKIKLLIYTLDSNGMSWVPEVNAAFGGNQTIYGDNLQNNSPLGIYFSKSILPKNFNKPEKEFYQRSEKMHHSLTHQTSRVFLDKEIQKIQSHILNYSESLFQLIKFLIKGQGKDAVFKWLGASIQGNVSRTKLGAELMQMHRFSNNLSKVSSDGFMLNHLYILLKFCKPFLVQGDKRLQKIDPTYLHSGYRFSLKSETPLCTNKDQESKFVLPENYGTISQFFFLTLQSLHFGYLPIFKKLSQIQKQIHQLKKYKQNISQAHPDYSKIDMQINALSQKRMIYQVQLLEPSILKDISQIYFILSTQLLQWGEASGKTWALRDPPCQILKILPEHLFFDYANFMEFALGMNTMKIQSFQLNAIFQLFIVFMRSQNAVSNPFLRIELLKPIMVVLNRDQSLRFSDGHLKQNQVVKNCLIQALIHLYIEVQTTGSSNQFYQKFHHRNLMSLIFQKLWKVNFFIDSTRALKDDPIFEKFLNTLVNDTNWCLDEGLAKLAEIKKEELKTEQGHVMNAEEKKNSDQSRGTAKAVFQIANESMKLLKSVSVWAKDVFFLPSIAQSISQMLNFVIMKLVGPKALELKVNRPEKLLFKPVGIIQDVIQILLSLGSNDEFNTALVKDQRCFKIEYYQKAKRILKKQGVVHNLHQLQIYIQLLIEKDTNEADLDQILNDPPDQFICPLSCDLMRDPVYLKTSGNICERSWMKRVILNDGADPFNRMPLAEKDLEDEVELKARIQKWIKQKIAGQVTDQDIRMQKEQSQQKVQNEQKFAKPSQPSKPSQEEIKMEVERSAFDDDDDDNPNQLNIINSQFGNIEGGEEMDADLLKALQLSMNESNKKKD